MIVEVRTYKIKPGLREKFLAFFGGRAVPLQWSKGIAVFGPLVDLEHSDTFHWLRAFPSLEERDRMKSALYDGDEWKNELEAIAMPMLESYSVALTTTTEAFVDFGTANVA
jgi:hypothetical protein